MTFKTILCFCLGLFLSFASHTAHAAKAPPNLAVLYDELFVHLAKGGAYIYVAPFAAINTDTTDQPNWWTNCAYTRLISEEGMQQAAAINQAIRRMGFFVGYAQSGEHCTLRTSLTYLISKAWIGRVITSTDLDSVEVQRAQGRSDEVIATLLSGQFRNGHGDAAKLMVGEVMPREVAPHAVLSMLSPGDTAVFIHSDRIEEPRLLARLSPQQWTEMSEYLASKVRANAKGKNKKATR